MHNTPRIYSISYIAELQRLPFPASLHHHNPPTLYLKTLSVILPTVDRQIPFAVCQRGREISVKVNIYHVSTPLTPIVVTPVNMKIKNVYSILFCPSGLSLMSTFMFIGRKFGIPVPSGQFSGLVLSTMKGIPNDCSIGTVEMAESERWAFGDGRACSAAPIRSRAWVAAGGIPPSETVRVVCWWDDMVFLKELIG